jgi:hypothetical protein
VGFLEYARSMLFEKDELKIKLSVSPKFRFPQFFRDEVGFVIVLPEPIVREVEGEEKTVSLMGYCFPGDSEGKRQLTCLFRAAVFHLSAHAVSASFEDYEEWRRRKDSRLARFAISVVEDVVANAYVSAHYPDKLVDLAFANALALKRLLPLDNLVNPATKVMAGLLVRVNTGFVKVESRSEQKLINRLAKLVAGFKEKALLSFKDGNVDLNNEKVKVAEEIYSAIEDSGPVTEVPFLPHTEELGKCSVFHRSYFVDSDVVREDDFRKCLDFLGGAVPFSEGEEGGWRKVGGVEGFQVFNSWEHEKGRNEKIVARYEDLLDSTRFEGVEIPELNYAEFLRTKARCKSEARILVRVMRGWFCLMLVGA